MKEIEEILEAHKVIQSSEDELYKRMESDYGLFRGEEYKAEKGYESFTDNTPQNVSGKVTDLIGKAQRRLWVPITSEDETERRFISDTERMVKGCFQLLDRQLSARSEPGLQKQMSWYAVNRGWILPYILILKNKKDKKTTLKGGVLDRRWTTFEIGEYGAMWLCSEKTISGRQAEYLYDLEDTPTEVPIYYFFDTKNFGIFSGERDKNSGKVNAGEWLVELTPHGFGRCPVVIKPVGATPYIVASDYSDTIKDVGESVFSNTRNLYGPTNKVLSWMMDMIAFGRKPVKIHQSLDGRKTFAEDPNRAGAELQTSWQDKEEVKYLENPRMPFETPTMLQVLDGKIQQGTLPATAFGNAPFALSGYAYEMLRYGMGSLIDRYAEAVAESYEEMARLISEEFASGGFKPIKIPVDDKKKGYNIYEEFKPSQIQGYEFECDLEIGMPQDDMKKWQIATLAHGGPNPLLSAGTVRETLLKLEDTDLEDDKLLEEFASNEPTVKLLKTLDAMRRRNAPDEEWMPIALDLQELRMQRMKQYVNSLGGGGGGQGGTQPSSTPQAAPPPNTQTGMGAMPLGG